MTQINLYKIHEDERYHSWNSLSASRGYPLLHPLRPRDLQPPRLRRRGERVGQAD